MGWEKYEFAGARYDKCLKKRRKSKEKLAVWIKE
jgi:hypothetical protein